MTLNYYKNTFKNFSSEYFCLIPSKYVTFGSSPFNKINSYISENSSKKDNSIYYRQFPKIKSEKFKFDSDKSAFKEKFNNILSKSFTPNKIIDNNITQENSDCYLNTFKTGSKSILNMVNSCLLDLFQTPKEKKEINFDIKTKLDTDINISNNKNYILKTLNEDCIFINNENNFSKKNNNADSFLQKINFSPIKNNSINDNIKQSSISPEQDFDKILVRNEPNIQKDDNNFINQNKFWNKSAFNIINNNYENPAKILPQFNQPPKILYEPNISINGIQNITNITNVTNNYFFQCDNVENFFMKQNNIIENNQNYKNVNNIIIRKNNNLLSNSCFKITNNKEDNCIEENTQNKNITNIKNSNADSYGLYQLNQISVNGVSISKFPVVSMNEDDLEVQLLSKMLTETDYFTIVDKYYINIPVLDEEKYSKPLYDKIFKKEKEKISDLYIIGKNLNENNPINLIRNFYSQIKSKILQIQKNYLSDNKREINTNKDLCKELEKLITSCNAITNTVTDYKKSGLKRKVFQEENNNDKKNIVNIICINKDNNNNINKDNSDLNNNEESLDENNLLNKKRKQKKKHFKTYLCEFCNKAYSNGQGLGGHMSRIHPNQSYKYKDKIRIRREREEKRENLLNIKRELFKKYGFDYDKLSTEKNKTLIQKFLSEHNEEYKTIRKNRPKNERNKENISNDNEEITNQKANTLITPMHPKLLNITPNKLILMNNMNKNLSKEKTCDKTEIKFEDIKINVREEEIGFETKMKINFGQNEN